MNDSKYLVKSLKSVSLLVERKLVTVVGEFKQFGAHFVWIKNWYIAFSTFADLVEYALVEVLEAVYEGLNLVWAGRVASIKHVFKLSLYFREMPQGLQTDVQKAI